MKKLFIGIFAVFVFIGVMTKLEKSFNAPLCPRYAGYVIEHKNVVRGVFGALQTVLVVRGNSTTKFIEVSEDNFARYRVGDTIVCQPQNTPLQ